jgi:hypothetical protein
MPPGDAAITGLLRDWRAGDRGALDRHARLHSDRDFDPFERHLGLTVVHPSPE